MLLAGIDIETTGTDPYRNHRIIQIGVVAGDYYILRPVKPTGEMAITEEAMQVNGLDMGYVNSGEPTENVDKYIYTYFVSNNYSVGSLTPVGWNVGSFDMAFLKKEMPLTASLFHYRALDLTALALFYSDVSGKDFKTVKTELHAETVKRMGYDNLHNALWDARAALVTLQIFKELLVANI